jgi:DNA polymerase
MDKEKLLKKLKIEAENDKSLPLATNLVFGEGNPNAEVLFIGEAPGLSEDMQKRPFVGRSGKLLDKLINKAGWQRSDVYITNIVKRRPPENRDPSPKEIEAYKAYLIRQIDIINPKIIATLGRFSMNYFLPLAKISNDQGKIFWKDGRLIMPLYHPAAALRSTKVMAELEKSFKKLITIKNKYELLKLKQKMKACKNFHRANKSV